MNWCESGSDGRDGGRCRSMTALFPLACWPTHGDRCGRPPGKDGLMVRRLNGHEMADGKKFCGNCGAVPDRTTAAETAKTTDGQLSTCPSGHENRSGAKFCRTYGVTPAASAVQVQSTKAVVIGAPAPPLPPAPVVAALVASAAEVAHPLVRPAASEFRAYEDEILPPEEQPTRNLVVILIDNSGSMAEAGFSPTRTRLRELNDALRSFLTGPMHEVPQLEMNGEIAIAAFAHRQVDWLSLDGKQAPGSPFHFARYIKSFIAMPPTAEHTLPVLPLVVVRNPSRVATPVKLMTPDAGSTGGVGVVAAADPVGFAEFLDGITRRVGVVDGLATAPGAAVEAASEVEDSRGVERV